MRVLVAGAAGFVGSHLTARLLEDGHSVVAVDNLITGHRRNLAAHLSNPRLEFLTESVIKPLPIKGSLDWVLHFASPASPPKYLKYPLETFRTNSEGTLHLLELARAKQASFLLASTSEIYGDPSVHPQPESYWGNVNSIGPRSVYDEGKRYAEALTMSFHREFHLPVRLIRIFNTYGPNMDPEDGRVITGLLCQAIQRRPMTVFGDGHQTRSLQYVDDLVEGVMRLLKVDYAGPVNLGNPEEYTILELAKLIQQITGSDSPIEFHPLPQDDPRQRKPDISLARRLLNWEPRVSVPEGLLLTKEYLRSTLARVS